MKIDCVTITIVFIIALLVSVIAVFGIAICVMIYDPFFAPTSDVCTSVRYNTIDRVFTTDERFRLHVYNTGLNGYLMERQDIPLTLTIRRGVFDDYIVGERSYTPIDTSPRRVPEGYTGKCTI